MWACKTSFTVLLQPNCSWCEFSPHLVVLTLFGNFWHKESLLNLPILLPLSGLGGGGLRCPMTRLKSVIQKLPILWCPNVVTMFILKTCSDQILAKLINLGGCCCSSHQEVPKIYKMKNFSLLGNCWNWHGGGGSRRPILDIKTNSFLKLTHFPGVNSQIWWLVPFFRGKFCDISKTRRATDF